MATANTHDAAGDGASDESGRIGTEPIDGDGRYPFAGLTRYDDDVDAVTLPTGVVRDTSSMYHWAVNEAGWADGPGGGAERDISAAMLPERGLNTLIPQLPRANHARAAWVVPSTGEVIYTSKHNAVVDPSKCFELPRSREDAAKEISDVAGLSYTEVLEKIEQTSVSVVIDRHLTEEEAEALSFSRGGDEALFQIAGDNHSIINPQQPLEVLTDVLQDRGLGEHIFGEVTIDRGGGRATIDIYMDGKHVESPTFAEDRNPVVVGLQIQYSFFDDWAFRVCGQALDWQCANHIHRLTGREVVKFAGDIEARVEWEDLFSSVMDGLDDKLDQLGRIIEEASRETLDFSDLPQDFAEGFRDLRAPMWSALYYYLGLPQYLAEQAGERLMGRADDAFAPSWWDIHSGATYAVTHYDRGDRTAGGAYEQHARLANDMLLNPASMEEEVVSNYRAQRQSEDDTTLAAEGGGVADIYTAFDSVRERREAYEEWEEELRGMGISI